MSVEQEAEYQAAYDKAAAELEAAAQATTAPVAEVAKVDEAEVSKPEVVAEAAPAVDEMAELKARLEKAEKIAKDNQAWATKMAQEAAQFKREREQQQRAATKPAILEQNPELADAIRYIAQDPEPAQQAADARATYQDTITKVHPDAFAVDMPEELQTAIAAKWEALGQAASDPLAVVRVITEEKLAFAERQVGKRFAAEAAKLQQKTAMSVPGPGASSAAKAPVDAQLEEVQRIQKMSDADFQKEVRRVKGY